MGVGESGRERNSVKPKSIHYVFKNQVGSFTEVMMIN